MQLGILPSLTKDYILSKITQEQIFEYYLGIKVETGVILKTPSVIRPRDSNPTFSFRYSDNGKLRARDWAGYFWGDCFDLVAYILRLKADDKKSFNVILDQIVRDFRLHKYSDRTNIDTGNTYDVREVIKKRGKVIIQFQPRNWDLYIDKPFWKDGGNISSKLLEKGRVYPCQYVWVNNNLVYNYNPKDPGYAYYFNQNNIQIYFPKRKEYKFLNNNTEFLPGSDLIRPARVGFIIKAYKDALSMLSYDIQAVSLRSESIIITKEEWWSIKHLCDHWFSLMDFDRTGILMAKKLRDLYNIRPLFFSNYKPLQKLRDKDGAFKGNILAGNYQAFAGVKDFYDHRKLLGHESTLELINRVKDHYSDIFDSYDKDMYEQLKWIKNKH